MDSAWFWLVIIILGVVGLVILVSYLNRPKCPKCGKRDSLSTSRKTVKSERISIKKEETIKHYSKDQTAAGRPIAVMPESVSKRTYTVPGIRTYYDVKYTCRACGESFTRREYTDNEM